MKNKKLSLTFLAAVLGLGLYFSGSIQKMTAPNNNRSLASKNKFEFTFLNARQYLSHTNYKRLGQNNSVDRTDVIDPDLQNCIVEMCGSPSSFFSKDEMDQITRSFDPSVKSRFEDLIYENINTNLKLLKAESDFKAQIREQNTSSNFEVSDAVKTLILGFEYQDILSEFLTIYVQTHREYQLLNTNSRAFWQRLDFERVEFAINEMSLNANDRLWFKNLLEQGLLLDMKLSMNVVAELELETLLKLLYPEQQFMEALQLQTQKMTDFSIQFNSSLGLINSFPNLLFPNASKLHRDINVTYEPADLASEIAVHYLFSQYFNDKYKSILDRTFNWGVFVRGALNSNTQYVQALNDSTIIQDVIQNNKSQCMDNISITLDQSNSALRNRRFRSLINDVLDVTKKQIQFSSPQLQTQFEASIDQLGVFTIRDLTSLKRILDASIQNQTTHAENYTRVFEENPNAAFQLILIESLKKTFSGADLNSLAEPQQRDYLIEKIGNSFVFNVNDICSMYTRPTQSDHVLTTEGQSLISWSSVRFPKYGVGIVAHEVAHYVSKVLMTLASENPGTYYLKLPESLPLWEKRECINSFTPQRLTRETDLKVLDLSQWRDPLNPDEYVYTEEDWADFFSAQITKTLKPKYPWISNFACQLFAKNGVDEYATVQDEFYSDLHSSDIRRALLVQRVMNLPMPNSCQKVIQEKALFQCL